MKLYTEEQVIKALFSIPNPEAISEVLLKEYTPIELPSDEEITEFILKNYYNRDTSHQAGFLKGAKWMKETILNQNK